jgi:hypothetical protein
MIRRVEDGLRRRARALLDYVESGVAFDFLTDIGAELRWTRSNRHTGIRHLIVELDDDV